MNTECTMNSVDLLLSAESKGTCRRRLEFIKPLKSINSFRCVQLGSNGSKHGSKSITSKSESLENTGASVVAKEKQCIFALSQVEANMRWSKISRAGPGFFNQGNTCFLNSTLQCLLHIPALVQILQKHSGEALKGLISKQHQGPQKSIAEHFMQLVVETGSSGGKSLSPRSMVQNIRRVGRQFRPGRQEDAHEYLRLLVDSMHEEVLRANGVKTSDGAIAETTFIARIFGGSLCNELRCKNCNYVSRTVNHFQDLSLEIAGKIGNLKDAVSAFTAPEILGNGNEWLCDGCKKRVKAAKQMKIRTPPPVLVLHLKRFSFGGSFGKINKHINFDEHMQLAHEPDDSGDRKTVKYSLIGIVVHHGHSVHSGHYVAFVKASNGQWHEMDDSVVKISSINKVLSQQAYILFYARESKQETSLAVSSASKAASTDLIHFPIARHAPLVDKHVKNAFEEKKIEEGVLLEESDSFVCRKTRLPQMISWCLLPMKFRGGYQSLFGRWKYRVPDVPLRNRASVLGQKRSINDGATLVDSDSSYKVVPTKSVPGKGGVVSASDRADGENVLQYLVRDGKRFRIGGSDGIWDTVTEETLSAVKKATVTQRNLEKNILESRKISDWDVHLDAGRKKKVKSVKDIATDEGRSGWGENDNPFQKILDDRKDGMGGSSYQPTFLSGKKFKRNHH